MVGSEISRLYVIVVNSWKQNSTKSFPFVRKFRVMALNNSSVSIDHISRRREAPDKIQTSVFQ